MRGLTSTAEVKSLSMKETQAWGNCCIFCQSEGWIITYKQPIKMLNKTFKTKHQNNKSSHSESWISDWPIVTGIMIIILSLILLGFNSSKSVFKDNISSCHWRFFRIFKPAFITFWSICLSYDVTTSLRIILMVAHGVWPTQTLNFYHYSFM